MFKPLRLAKFLNAILLIACVGCTHGGESPSSAADVKSNDASGTISPVIVTPPRFTNSDGSPLAVGNDGSLIDGMVIARCVITEEGNVEQCKIAQNPFATKDAEIVAVLQKQHFEPVIFEGKPQRVNYTFRIRFKGADEDTNDLRKICHVHEITGKSPELGVQAVSQWLTDNVKTREARKRLAELPEANIPIWLQTLRKDAEAKGISPCPFADYWEDFLTRPAPEGITRTTP